MKNQHLKPTAIFLACFLPFGVYSSENPAMDSFFEKDNNQKKFETVKSTGALKKSKLKMIEMCEKEKNKKGTESKLDCVCYKKELEKTPDKEFFYGSLLAYQQFLERSAALKGEDQSKYEALKKAHAKQETFATRIEKKCKE